MNEDFFDRKIKIIGIKLFLIYKKINKNIKYIKISILFPSNFYITLKHLDKYTRDSSYSLFFINKSDKSIIF